MTVGLSLQIDAGIPRTAHDVPSNVRSLPFQAPNYVMIYSSRDFIQIVAARVTTCLCQNAPPPK